MTEFMEAALRPVTVIVTASCPVAVFVSANVNVCSRAATMRVPGSSDITSVPLILSHELTDTARTPPSALTRERLRTRSDWLPVSPVRRILSFKMSRQCMHSK